MGRVDVVCLPTLATTWRFAQEIVALHVKEQGTAPAVKSKFAGFGEDEDEESFLFRALMNMFGAQE